MTQTTQHGRTPFRHDQGLDGRDAFPDATAAKRPHRDGAARPRLQHQADDRPRRHRPLVRRNPKVNPRLLLQIGQPTENAMPRRHRHHPPSLRGVPTQARPKAAVRRSPRPFPEAAVRMRRIAEGSLNLPCLASPPKSRGSGLRDHRGARRGRVPGGQDLCPVGGVGRRGPPQKGWMCPSVGSRGADLEDGVADSRRSDRCPPSLTRPGRARSRGVAGVSAQKDPTPVRAGRARRCRPECIAG